MILYDVRGGSAGIDVSVVDPRFRDHVLSQIVAAHVHKLDCIQGASSEVRGSTGVRGNPLKIEVCAHDGIAVIALDGILRCRMPGIYEIDVVKHACAGHELLGTSAFLSRAAEIDDGSVLLVGDQVFLDSQGSGESAGTERAVSAAMSRSAFL